MKVKLGDVAILINGDRGKNYPSQIDIVPNGDVPFVNAGHLDGRNINFNEMNYISKEKYDQLNSGKFREGDILYCLRGSLGKKAVVKSSMEGAIASSLVIIRPDATKVEADYLMFALDSPSIREQLIKANNGSSQPNLSAASVRNYDIDLPDKKVQEDIVRRLSKVRAIIDARQQEVYKLDELIKARFVELFDVQKCQRKTLGECTDFVDYRGYTPELSDTGTIRMVNAKSVGKGFFKYVDEYVTERTYTSWMHRGFGYPGDILFVTEGHTFGNTCLIPNELKKFALGQRVITIKGHQEVRNAFLCSYMQTDMFWRDINVFRTGGTAQGIRSKDLVKVSVPIPPIDLQEQFTSFVDQVDKSKLPRTKHLSLSNLLTINANQCVTHTTQGGTQNVEL